jgi:hypothetical protein
LRNTAAAGPVRLLVERGAAGVEVSRLDDAAWHFAAALCQGRPLVAALAGAGYAGAEALLAEHLAAGRFIDFQLLAPEEMPPLEASPEAVS